MKNYLLFATSDLKDLFSKSYIIDVMSDITQTQFLKYKAQDNFIVIHFGTELELIKIQEYLKKTLGKKFVLYFLTEKTDNMSCSLENKDLEEFLMLDEVDTDMTTLLDSQKDLLKEMQEECLNILLEEMSNSPKIEPVEEFLTLDGILDKINESGINSLTDSEKKFLNSYK